MTATPAQDNAVVVVDIYPLTPLQQGMLLHTLKSDRPGPYLEQFVLEIAGGCDPDRIMTAWNAVLERHGALRSAFVWEGLDEPHQIVVGGLTVPFEEIDLGTVPEEDLDVVLDSYLESDRARGLDLEDPPLMRLALFRRPTGDVMVWTVHHLILDGWSLPVILRDVATAYRCAADSEIPWPPAPAFRDFISWLGLRDTSAAKEFWTRRIEGHFATELPIRPGRPDERRGQVTSDRGWHDMGGEVGERIRAAAAHARVTVGTVFQAAWALTLARHQDSARALFGFTMASRPAEVLGIEDMVGPLITTVPFHVEIDDRATVSALLRQTQQQRLDIEPYQNTSLIDIGTWLQHPTDRPLFETILVIENYPSTGIDYSLGDGTAFELRSFREDTGYPLTVVVFPRDAGFRIQVMFDEARYDAESITTLLGRFEVVLTQLSADPTAPVGEIGLLATAAESELVDGDNDTDQPTRLDPVHLRLSEQARRTPDAVAVNDHGELTTYRALDELARARAAALVRHGVGPDIVVAIMQRRSTDLLVNVLAVMMAGGAYVVLDPGHPDSRLRYLMADSDVHLVISEPEFALRLPADRPVYSPGELDAAGVEPLAASRPVSPEHLCYITYTSGSTGRPKGIAMSHGAVANLIDWQLQRDDSRPCARTFGYASLSFDVSFQEMFLTWCAGGSLVLVWEDERANFELLVRLAREHDVQRWFIPAAALEQVAATAHQLQVPLPGLLALIAGSEPLHVTPELRWLLAQAPHGVLENQYGPSECHVVTSHVVEAAPADIADYPPIGRPLANTRAYVLDSRLRPVPVGVAGDLYLTGYGVARGYLGRPGLTAERFLPCPFAAAGARMYDTGDRARWNADGQIEFLGRRDSQVKIRGFRVEPGEIESVLGGQPAVREAIVVLRDLGGELRLIAYVVPQGDPAELDEGALTETLRQQLPDYMVPWAIVALGAFPLTVNRKIARDLLPVPEASTRHRPTTAGRTELSEPQRAMTAIWREVLGVAEVGLDDDFFRLGGHSLSAMRVTAKVRDRFAVPVGVGALFAQRTPRRLLQQVENLAATASPAQQANPREGG